MKEQIRSKADMLAYAKKQADTARQEAEQLEKIAAALPDDLKIAFIHAGTGYKADGSIKIVAADRAEAIAMVDKLPPVPIARVKGTFLTFKPADAVSDKEREQDDVTDEILPVIWKYDFDQAELTWWTQVAGLRIQVHCLIESDPARLVECHQRDNRGRIVRHEWRLTRVPLADSIDTFASGSHDRPGMRVAWFWREPGGGAPGLDHYLLTPNN